MPEIPVKVEHEGKWLVTKIDVSQEQMTIKEPFNVTIQFKSILDLEEKKNILSITVKGNPEKIFRVATVPKAMQILKRIIIMSCSAYRLSAYFMSPAIRGGVLVTDAKWDKGAIAVLKTGIWFVSQEKQVCVPTTEVTGIEMVKRDIQKKQLDVVKIDHLENNEVVTSFVLCPLSTLQVLLNFLKDATKDLEMRGDELDPVSSQVGMLIYSGMDSHAIENMLNISHKELDSIVEKLLKLGMVEVMFIRREVQLTPKGVRFISDAVKPPAQ
ncbi:MAG TPA: CheF family chemotaxis protein [Methanoregulaceae archaeon]|nr:CheF family chemotaxis protein [Methanoregulaceae archaeon]